MSRWRRAAYVLMLVEIIKHILSNEYGPFDRLLEIGVFALIAYEVVVGIQRHRKEKKRNQWLAAISGNLCDHLNDGQKTE